MVGIEMHPHVDQDATEVFSYNLWDYLKAEHSDRVAKVRVCWLTSQHGRAPRRGTGRGTGRRRRGGVDVGEQKAQEGCGTRARRFELTHG